MSKILIVLLCLALPVLGGPGDWGGTEHGPDAGVPTAGAVPEGNADEMTAVAGPLVTYVSVFALTDRDTPDKSDAASGCCTTWYSLKFVGSAGTTDHRWEIWTLVKGVGNAYVSTSSDGSGWGESVQAVQISGDNENAGLGQLAVQKDADVRLTITLPPGIRVPLTKSARKAEKDSFKVESPRTTTGAGMACRVRVDTAVDVGVSAKSTIGVAAVNLWGRLRGDLRMTGYCKYNGETIRDDYKVTMDGDPAKSGVEPPEGGVTSDPDSDPTDTPTDEEREHGGLVKPGPEVDAADVGDPTTPDTPGAVEEGDTPEEDGGPPPDSGEEPGNPEATQ